jgi:Mrp family chromosome partitioning ATPase/capsular polysaccharide biosynthesis protein
LAIGERGQDGYARRAVSSDLPPTAPPGDAPVWTSAEPAPEQGALGPYVRAIRSHKALVVAIWLAIVAGSVAGVALRQPVYEANAQLLVTPLSAEDRSFLGLPVVRESGDPTRTLQTAATLADSEQAAALTARRIGRGWTVDEVTEAVEVLPQGESSILAVRARADVAARAAQVANTFASSVIIVRRSALRRLARAAIADTRAQLAQPGLPTSVTSELSTRLSDLQSLRDGTDPTLAISEIASIPRTPENVPSWLVVLIGVVAGGVLATGTALIFELFTPQPITRESELLALYPLPVLARIPALPRRRWGRRRAGPLPPPTPDASEAYRFVQAQLELGKGRPRSVLFTSPSAGDGKTASIVGFARELAAGGRTAILIDLDLRSPGLATALGVEPRRDITAVLTPKGRLSRALTPVDDASSIKVAAATQQEGGAVLGRVARVLPDLLDEGLRQADYVLIDTPPLGEVSDALQVAGDVDDVVIVVRLGNTRPRSLATLRELLERMGRGVSGYVIIGGTNVSGRGYAPAQPALASAERPARVETSRATRHSSSH